MTIKNRIEDDGYTGFLMNPDTGQVLRANKHLNQDPFYIRVKSAADAPKVNASKHIVHAEDLKEDRKLNDQPVVEATPEAEDTVDEDSAELALVSIEAEVAGCEDKSTLKAVGNTLGLNLTKAMNTDTMQERIANQIEQIRAASTGE